MQSSFSSAVIWPKIKSLLLSNCLLSYLAKVVSYCLIRDSGLLNGLQSFGNLRSSICPSKAKKVCCITNILVRELSRMTFKRLLKVRKVLFPYVGDCFITSVCFFSYCVIWVASLKERNNILCFIREERLYDVGGKEEADVLVFLHLF